MVLEDVFGKKHHLTIRIDDIARAGHDAQTVGIAVKGKTKLRVAGLHCANQIVEVGGLTRIGMVMREVAVDFEIKRLDVRTESLKEAKYRVRRT